MGYPTIAALAETFNASRWTPSEDAGDRPRVEWHATDHLIVDPRFQRELGNQSRRLIRRIVENFQWRLFGIVICTDNTDGTFTVIDGQHRAIAAAIHATVRAVPVFVTDAEMLQEQAAAFLEINRGRIAMNALQMHKARRLAGDPVAIAVASACAATGVTVPGNVVSWNNLKPRQILCIGTLYRIQKNHGEDILRRTLAICANAWPDSPGDILAVNLNATARLLKTGDITDTALTTILRARPGDEWREDARTRGHFLGCDHTTALIQIIADRRQQHEGKAA